MLGGLLFLTEQNADWGRVKAVDVRGRNKENSCDVHELRARAPNGWQLMKLMYTCTDICLIHGEVSSQGHMA